MRDYRKIWELNVNQNFKCSHCTKFEGSTFRYGKLAAKISLRNVHTVKLGYWVIIRIFNELWGRFLKVSKVLPQ